MCPTSFYNQRNGFLPQIASARWTPPGQSSYNRFAPGRALAEKFTSKSYRKMHNIVV
jgi:hypothetical protein